MKFNAWLWFFLFENFSGSLFCLNFSSFRDYLKKFGSLLFLPFGYYKFLDSPFPCKLLKVVQGFFLHSSYPVQHEIMTSTKLSINPSEWSKKSFGFFMNFLDLLIPPISLLHGRRVRCVVMWRRVVPSLEFSILVVLCSHGCFIGSRRPSCSLSLICEIHPRAFKFCSLVRVSC